MTQSELNLKTLVFDYGGVSFPFKINEKEVIISENVEKTGGWEQNQLSLYDELIPDSGVMIDIGANVGVNSLFAHYLKPKARIVAIEASSENIIVLKQNTKQTTIEVWPVAISNRDGFIEFSGSGTNAHIGSGPHAYKVESKTLDSATKEIGEIDLLKIDVEGYTDLVLSEGSETTGKSKNIIIEFSIRDIRERFGDHASAQEHFSELWEKLPHFPYKYYISRGDGLVELASVADLNELLSLEHEVGDVLFSLTKRNSITIGGFAIRRIHDLMKQNHFRILEIQALQGHKSSLRRLFDRA
jgi:FkbM family methyltransferase